MHYTVVIAWLSSSSMREKCLINLKQRLLVVNEEIKQVALIPSREITQLYSVFGQLSESQQRLFKLTRFLRVFLDLLELLLVVNLIFQTSFHDVFAYFLYAINEQTL